MRSHSGGNLTALLMFAVLLAVPLLAIFGIPEFVPASISFSDEGAVLEDIKITSGQDSKGDPAASPFPGFTGSPFDASAPPAAGENRPRSGSARSGPENPFQLYEETGLISDDPVDNLFHNPPAPTLGNWELAERSLAAESHNTEPLVEPVAPVNSPAPPTRNDGNPFAQNTGTEPAAASTARQPLTWKQAVARLGALGIDKYRLEPGLNDNEFLFSCFLPSENNSHVIRRFEAEADDPLRAVEDVLRQIRNWRQEQ